MVETTGSVVPGKRLGLRPPSNKVALHIGTYLTSAVPDHPQQVEHMSGVAFGLDRNDRFGVCGPASLDNYRRLVTRYLTGQQQDATWEDVKALYVLQNPDFDEETGEGDDGVDMQTMLADAVKHGFAGTQVLGFAKVPLENPEVVRAVISLFGGVLMGLALRRVQEQQLADHHWNYDRFSPEWGGHAIVSGAYQFGVDDGVTWAERVSMSPTFIKYQCREAYAVILPEHLGSKRFVEGIDLAKYASDYYAITDRPFPAPIPGSDPEAGGASFRVSLPMAEAGRVRALAARQAVSPDQWVTDRLRAYLRSLT